MASLKALLSAYTARKRPVSGQRTLSKNEKSFNFMQMELARVLLIPGCSKTSPRQYDWMLNKYREVQIILASRDLVYYITTTPLFTHTKQVPP